MLKYIIEKPSTRILSNVARNSLMEDWFRGLSVVVQDAADAMNGLEGAIFISRAVPETVEKWEAFLGLPLEADWTWKDRAERVIYVLSSKVIFSPEYLKQQALLFTNGEIEVEEDFANYHFTVRFTSIIGRPPNLDNFREMVELNKPAHLLWDMKFRYRTHGELEPYTHESMEAYTHEQIFSAGIL